MVTVSVCVCVCSLKEGEAADEAKLEMWHQSHEGET